MGGTTTEPAPTETRRARPSPARERILATADRLFYDEGIHTVGVQRIVAEAQVTRVTFYRHFPAKDDLVAAYLDRRAAYDRRVVAGVIDAHPGDPRGALVELGEVLTRDDFGAVRRGCPFINASAEFVGSHPARVAAYDIRRWVTQQLAELLERAGHADPRGRAEQLMMARTGAVVSGALDRNPQLTRDFLDLWNRLVDEGLPAA